MKSSTHSSIHPSSLGFEVTYNSCHEVGGSKNDKCFVCLKQQTELYFEEEASTLPSLSHQFLTPENIPCGASTQTEKAPGADVGSAKVSGCCSITSYQSLITCGA